jgi:NADH-quinone oxidoreductase subunit G
VDCLPGWSVIPELAERLGRPLRYKSPARIMDEVAERVPAFAGATHDAMGLLGVPLEDVAAAV